MRRPALLFIVASLISSPALAVKPEAAKAHKEGLVFDKAGKTKEAIAKFKEAISIDPNFADAYLRLGNLQLRLKRLPAAIPSFEAALKLKPELQDARYNLAWSLRQTGNNKEAAKHYRLFLQRSPGDADAHYGLADALLKSGQSLAAAEAFDAYAKAEKRPAHAKWKRKAMEQAKSLRATAGAGATKTGPKATKTSAIPANRTLTPAPEKPAKSGKAEVHLSFSGQDKTESQGEGDPLAQRLSVPTMRSNGSRPQAFKAGISHLQSGDYSTALTRLQVAINEAPNDPLVIAAFGSAHLGLRNGPEAERAYRRALTVAAGLAQPGIYLGLGEAHRLQGQHQAAISAYNKAMQHESASNSIKRMSKERIFALSN